MSGAGRAIGWEFQRRHRVALMALAGYLVVLWAIKHLILGSRDQIELDPPNGMAAFVIVPFSATFVYFVGLFSFGLAGDLAGRESIFPARMFPLPVTTTALAGWPMLYGTATVASLWLAFALVARAPGAIGSALPLVSPALLAAAFLAWTQAFMWMPYGLPGARVVVAVLCLAAIDAVVLVAIHFKASEPLLVAMLAPQVPLAYVVARVAVARARRGDVPDWRGLFARSGQRSDGARQSDGFASSARAQTWFEWRRHGWSLPSMVGFVVPCELVLLFVPGNDTAPVVFTILAGVLLTPPLLAVFAAASLSQPTSYAATRPLTSAALIAAKLTMTIWSTLAAWLVVLVAIPAGLALSGTWPVVTERVRQGIDIAGTPRAIAIALLLLSGLLASTWKQLVQSLCIGLTGRAWLVRSSIVTALLLLAAIEPAAEWIDANSDVQAALWDAAPWILLALVSLKVSAATWIAIRLHDSRLLSDRMLVAGAACWLAAVLALYGVLEWFVATPLMPHYLLGSLAILGVPLARLSAAPLALAWNRHR